MSLNRTIGECLRIAIGGFLAGIVVRAWLVMGLVLPCRVTSESMEPTIQSGARLVIDRTPFWFRLPRRWEVVVFLCPDEPQALCVKRIAGLPGETVYIHEGAVFADGRPVPSPPEDFIYAPRPGRLDGDSPIHTLGHYEYFMLGDNAEVSEDSRLWQRPGIPSGWIVGKPISIKR